MGYRRRFEVGSPYRLDAGKIKKGVEKHLLELLGIDDDCRRIVEVEDYAKQQKPFLSRHAEDTKEKLRGQLGYVSFRELVQKIRTLLLTYVSQHEWNNAAEKLFKIAGEVCDDKAELEQLVRMQIVEMLLPPFKIQLFVRRRAILLHRALVWGMACLYAQLLVRKSKEDVSSAGETSETHA